MEKEKITVLYFGPITPKGEPSRGGYEAANRKNIDALRERGIEVVEFSNPQINRRIGPIGKLAYIKLFFLPLHLWKHRNRKKVILHTTPLYSHLLYPTLFTVRIAYMLKIPVLVDIRAGALITCWENKTFIFRRHIKELLNKATAITVESKTYIKQIKEIIGINKQVIYFPNVANCSNLQIIAKPDGLLNIFYFGRITKTKGISIMLNAIHRLGSRYKLYIAGTFGPDYSAKDLEKENVEYLGFLTPEQLKCQMSRMHFFIFPTSHVGEGQSNSLIEAMSNGLIPVVSDQGFNAEVVGENGKVLPKGSSDADYAKAIEELSSGDINAKAVACQKQIIKFHNLDIEIQKLIQIYKALV